MDQQSLRLRLSDLAQSLANPTRYMALSARVLPWITAAAACLLVIGLYLALVVSPPDYQQKEVVRIMYVHVPAAWIAMAGYLLVAVSSFGYLVFRHPLADVSAKSAAPIGAAFTALALVTGSIWGRPTWGSYWEWDARLTSVLILLFLYLGLIALRNAAEDETEAAKLTAILGLVGVALLPVIKFSVEWWGSLHQPSTRFTSTVHPSMRTALLVNAVAFTLVFVAMHMKAMRNEILRRRLKALQVAAVRQARGVGAMSVDGEHTAFIVAAYLITGVVLAALVIWLVAQGRRTQKALDALEAKGVRRRSSPE